MEDVMFLRGTQKCTRIL